MAKRTETEVEVVVDVVDVLALVDCGSADAIDVEVVDANIVDNIEVKDKVGGHGSSI